jgi:asparagine synthase (glutamine-hydrolysing)
MCGIAGVMGAGQASNDACALALDAMDHRGPDDRGSRVLDVDGTRVWLGQTRLAIIDLSPGGLQPMSFADERYWIVFNGEIYNYRELREELRAQGVAFRTESDTEVLLASWAAWGEQAIPRLRGMFAFAVLDRHRGELVCARDAFGIKPFYFGTSGETWAFASEPTVVADLLGVKRRLNDQRLFEYLTFGASDRIGSTAFADVQSLPPGHVMRMELSDTTRTTSSRRWWNPSLEERRVPRAEAVETVREMFLQNIRLHLRSDVPLAVALSGGIDSSGITCGVRSVVGDAELHTFSYVSSDDAQSEARWVDSVNAHVGARPHRVVIGQDDLVRDIDDVIRALGEPFGSTSIYAQYRIFQAVREQGFTVTLDGQGADEIFGGYVGYPDFRMLSMLRRGDLIGMYRFLQAWGTEPDRSRKGVLRGVAAALAGDDVRRIVGARFEARQLPAWVDRSYVRDRGLRARALPRARADWRPGRDLASRLYKAISHGELATLLRHGDRTAMRWSIESRTPFLTTDLAEYALSLPESYLVSPQGTTKSVLREALTGLVPADVLARRDKLGFATPESQWLRNLRPVLGTWLDDVDMLPMLDPTATRRFVTEALDQQRPLSGSVWRILCAIRWARLLDVSAA